MATRSATAHRQPMMTVEHLVLAQLLSLAALIAAAAEYSVLIHRRADRRVAAQRHAVEDAGLQGLVRVFLTEPTRHD